MKEINTASVRDLFLRPSLDYVFSESELDFFFRTQIVALLDSSESDIKLVATKYFEDYEGEWYMETEKDNIYMLVVPSEVSSCSKTKEFLDDLLDRNEWDISEIMNDLCSDGDDDDLEDYLSEDE
ncbi:MAG TPA: hypothetical protein PLD18_08650 [Flavobacterium sp.]|nr:hypothetical protein [Flavobacterium sp.]HRA72306.1 hypothetical protein [Flavobacterium sp.]